MCPCSYRLMYPYNYHSYGTVCHCKRFNCYCYLYDVCVYDGCDHVFCFFSQAGPTHFPMDNEELLDFEYVYGMTNRLRGNVSISLSLSILEHNFISHVILVEKAFRNRKFWTRKVWSFFLLVSFYFDIILGVKGDHF